MHWSYWGTLGVVLFTDRQKKRYSLEELRLLAEEQARLTLAGEEINLGLLRFRPGRPEKSKQSQNESWCAYKHINQWSETKHRFIASYV